VDPVWLIPVAALLVGGAAIVALGRSAVDEARLLTAELARQRALVDALVRLGEGLSDLGGHLPRR